MPRELWHDAIEAAHSNHFSGGHMGVEKTIARLSNHFWWYGMYTTVTEAVKQCPDCARANSQTPNAAKGTGTVPAVAGPNSLLGIDHIGPFQEAGDGYKYVLVAIDHFTKWLTAVPGRSTGKDESVDAMIDHVFCRTGLLDAVLTDNGTAFANRLSAKLLERMGVTHKFATLLHLREIASWSAQTAR